MSRQSISSLSEVLAGGAGPDGRVTAAWLPRFARTRLTAWRRDRGNRARYGAEAPRFAERIWIDPHSLHHAVVGLSREDSGRVWEGAWPPPPGEIVPLMELSKIRSAIEHFRDGVPWGETAHYRETKGVGKYADPAYWGRYEELYERVRRAGGLKTRPRVNPGNFRERGGILVHIGPDGTLYHGDGGNRRLAVALALGLERVPAQVGWVAGDALGVLADLRE